MKEKIKPLPSEQEDACELIATEIDTLCEWNRQTFYQEMRKDQIPGAQVARDMESPNGS